MLKQILPFAKKANIILIVINQINRRISTGFIPQARELVGLGDNEALSGGRASLYMANNVLRLKNKGMLKSDKDYGINGHIIEATYLKSRTAASYVPFELIFDKQNGYSPALTLFHLGFTNNFIKKSGNKYYVDGLQDILFSKKECMKVAHDHPEILNRLYDLSLPIMQSYLGVDTGTGNSTDKDEDKNTYIDIMNSLLDD